MRRIRAVVLATMAVAAVMSAAAVSVAAGAGPKFVSDTSGEVKDRGFTGFGREATFATKTFDFTCKRVAAAGEIEAGAAGNKIANVSITFDGCVGPGKCKVNSAGHFGEEVVQTVRLQGELGEVNAAEAGNETGLSLESQGTPGGEVTELQCLNLNNNKPFMVTGGVIGEISPARKKKAVDKAKLELESDAGPKQKIQKFKAGNVGAKTLTALGEELTVDATIDITWKEPVDVT